MIRLTKHLSKSINKGQRVRPSLLTPLNLSKGISSIQKYKPGFILGKLKQMMKSRSSLYKLFFVATSVQIGYFTIQSLSSASTTILTVEDVLTREDINDDDSFELVLKFHIFLN